MPHAALRLHSRNPKIFEFRGEPLVLICATEHYGSVLNRPFDFEKYFEDARDKKQTLTRLFMLFREQQGSTNPYSTCKPESTDYISPFPRTGPSLACDGQPKYDLDQWNPEFFERLHRVIKAASKNAVVVEVVLLSNSYTDSVWALNPLHQPNNINDVESVPWPDYLSTRHPKLFAWQCAHVRKIVKELNPYDNIFFEICNEPGGAAWPGAPTVDEVNSWQSAIARIIRDTEARLPNKHLIAGQEAFAYLVPDDSQRAGPDVYQFADASFDTMDFDIVNMHPLSNMVLREKRYNVGEFMMAQLRLRELQRYCRALFAEKKPFNFDEDNCATQYKDFNGWTIHRKRAWTTLFCGGHYDMIDFSIINYCPTGTPESQRCLRSWMKHLSEYVHSLDLVRSRPLRTSLGELPEHVVSASFGIENEDLSIYFADARELGEPGQGEPIQLQLVLPFGSESYQVRSYSLVSGTFSPGLFTAGNAAFVLPAFTHDLVLRVSRAK